MTLILWIILGAFCGWIASMITGDNAQMGPVANIVVGIVGGLVGGTLYNLIATGRFDLENTLSNFNVGSVILGIVGSVILLAILKVFNKAPSSKF